MRSIEKKQDTLSQLSCYAHSKKLRNFIHILYGELPDEELAELDNDYLLNVAKFSFDFLSHYNYEKELCKIKVFTSESDDTRAVITILSKDLAFLVDSIGNELKAQGCEIQLISHPSFWVKRDPKGNLLKLEYNEEANKESILQFHILNSFSKAQYEQIIQRLHAVVQCVNLAVNDWGDMKTRMGQGVKFVKEQLPDPEERGEVVEFLTWLINKNFVFLGSYSCSIENSKVVTDKGSELGILKSPLYSGLRPDFDVHTEDNEVIFIRKWEHKSVVHRDTNLDCLVIKKMDGSGKLSSALVFLGFFTSSVYYQSVRQIPYIRKKINRVIQRYGHPENSHNGRVLITAIEAFPRGELLQLSEDELFETAIGIVSLSMMPRVKVFMRKDKVGKFVSCLIFIQKSKFSTQVRSMIEEIACKHLHGVVVRQYVQIGEGPLVRLQLIIKTLSETIPNVDIEVIENDVVSAINSWEDNLKEVLGKKLHKRKALVRFNKYKEAFDIKYKSTFSSTQAVHDIEQLEVCAQEGIIKAEIDCKRDYDDLTGLKIYSPNKPLALSSLLPTIENLGFFATDVSNFKIVSKELDGYNKHYIHYFRLSASCGNIEITKQAKENIETLLEAIWQDKTEDDKFNTLVLYAGLKWREAVLMRAYASYLKQISMAHSFELIADVLLKNPVITKLLVKLFNKKFDPKVSRKQSEIDAIIESINAEIEKVEDLAEDKILNSYLDILKATSRTNFFQKDGSGNLKNYISLKIMSGQINMMPLPKPFAEIFVYSSLVEAIHLRGGKVARGGLRWSDRKEDYRTEVLGLMKAQMTKNSIIVPSGSKGGFILKKRYHSADRDTHLRNGIKAYQTFLSGILDITDNIVHGKVITPSGVIKYDGEDSYLVVAADKGTATFSDYANEVSKSYNFWLGDAFASGGSSGYDHKEIGITAKGAWVSVERHFRELGLNMERDPFTVVGIGDMSGDVFGNGMLLSRNIKLVAAFNHMHIFLDPNPDPEISYQERLRLFRTPRTQWSDYNPDLISPGGGTYSRKLKSIKVSEEVKQALGINQSALAPDELIKAILKAPIDLLWNGGIGTYVKSSKESHGDVGDKANDRVRVDGRDLRCRVVGEGGNLGLTQAGRVEYAHLGGMINTDFIDNSAGVDCSDHEVNIKIAFQPLLAKDELNLSQRNTLLEEMKEEVAKLVLRDNYMQAQIISLENGKTNRYLEEHSWIIKRLESAGELDRELEQLPSKEEFAAFASEGKTLSRPSISVIIAYVKNSVAKHISNINFLEDKYFENYLLNYFPTPMRLRFKDAILKHELRNEIICTIVANEFVNTLGCCLFHQLLDDGWHPLDIIQSFILVKEAFGISELWNRVESLDNKVNKATQIATFTEIQTFLERNIVWALRYNLSLQDSTYIAELKTQVQKLKEMIAKQEIKLWVFDTKNSAISNLLDQGELTKEIYEEVRQLQALTPALDIIHISKHSNLDIAKVAYFYHKVGEHLYLDWMLLQSKQQVYKSYIDMIAVKAIDNDINDLQITFAIAEIEVHSENPQEDDRLLCIKSPDKLASYINFIQDAKATYSTSISLATLTVALRRAKELLEK